MSGTLSPGTAKERSSRPLLRRLSGLRRPVLRRARLRRIAGRRRGPGVWLYGIALWLGVLALWAVFLAHQSALPAPIRLGWPVLAVLFFVAERFVLDLEVREQTHSFSLSEIALVLGLTFAAPADVLLGQALGAGVALLLRPGQRPVKIFFNLASFALATSVALAVFRGVLGATDLGTTEPLSPVGWLAAFGAALASDVTGAVAVAGVIWITQRERPSVSSLFGFGTAYMLVATSLALVAATVLWYAPASSWLLIVLVALAYVGIRIHGRELRRQHSLLGLHESTRRLAEAFSLDDVSPLLLATAREMFDGETAEMLIFPREGSNGRLRRLSDAGDSGWERYQLDPSEGVWARVSAEGRGVAIRPQASSRSLGRALGQWRQRLFGGRGATSAKVLAHFDERGIRGALVAPLRINDISIGTLLVGNRRGSSAAWSDDELTLFETLANHASVALHNSRQADELASQRDELERTATHDGLTGLPNRVLFHARLGEALTARPPAVAVLVMDLDHFKEVNDTLGHQNGDLLLREVAGRLHGQLVAEPAMLVARLGGDEFAVLMSGVDTNAALACADRLLAALRAPFSVAGVSVQVEGSVGICLAPMHGDDADTLLQRADVAMYRAKADHSRYAIYEPQNDPYSEARLALLGELRRAIETRQLSVAYQPQADAETGRVDGFEALLRWRHPVRGDLRPDQFIALAERSELIHALTRFMLREAIAQCALWQRQGEPVRVSVNLSARNLLDETLAEHITALLAAEGVPAASLVLEITETAIESNPVRTEALLDRLREVGVGIAIDDFGTGYSSFGYLARLHVDEIKIDRSFVAGMDVDERHLAIVRSTIQLGHNLGLRVVAEGVESETIRRRLARLGCDVVQGYHIGRPVSAELAGAQLRRSRAPGGRGLRRAG